VEVLLRLLQRSALLLPLLLLVRTDRRELVVVVCACRSAGCFGHRRRKSDGGISIEQQWHSRDTGERQ
jgi:hypothetical protein